MSSDDTEVVKAACSKLSSTDDAGEMKAAFDEISMTCNDHDKREASLSILLEADIPVVILNAMKKWNDSEFVIAQALTAVHNSALSNELAYQYINHQAIDIVVEGMNKFKDNAFVQTRGCGCLGTLINAVKEQNDSLITTVIPLIKQYEMGTLMVSAMDLHPDNSKLHRWAMKGLEVITSITELRDYFIEDITTLEGIVRGYCRCRKLPEDDPFVNDITKFAWSCILRFQPPSTFPVEAE